MNQILQRQYELIKGSREALFQYCSKIKETDFKNPVSFSGRGSIRDLLVHNANVYIFWVANFGLKNNTPFYEPQVYHEAGQVKEIYGHVDQLIEEFLNHYKENIEVSLGGKIPRRDVPIKTTPLKLFTHVVTHEFHHKGQILSISRELGYTPADTDVLRFE